MKGATTGTSVLKSGFSGREILLFVSLLLLIGLVIAISIMGITQSNVDEKRNIIEHVEQDVTLSAVKIESHVGRTQQVLRKSVVAVGGGLIDLRCEEEGSEISLLFASPEGVVEGCTSSEVAGYLRLNIGQKEYFTVPRDTGEDYVSGVEKIGNSGAVVVSSPVFEVVRYTSSQQVIGAFEGVLFTIIDLEELHHRYFVPLVNAGKRGYLLFDLGRNQTLLSAGVNAELVDFYLKPLPIQGKVVEFNGSTQFITTRDILFGSERWRLVVREDVPSYLSSQFILLFVIGVMLLTVLIFSVVHLVRKRVRHELTCLHADKIMERGDVTKIRVVKTLAELGVIPQKETLSFFASKLILKPGGMYVICSEEIESGYDLFATSIAQNRFGLILSRTFVVSPSNKFGVVVTPLVKIGDDGITKTEDILNVCLEF